MNKCYVVIHDLGCNSETEVIRVFINKNRCIDYVIYLNEMNDKLFEFYYFEEVELIV